MDSEFARENASLLVGRWTYLQENQDGPAYAAFGLDADTAGDLLRLDQRQVERAGDVEAPLFRLDVVDTVLAKLLSDSEPTRKALLPTEELILTENLQFLTNRWGAARLSAAHATCQYGLSRTAADLLRNASLYAVQRACHKGVRLVKFAAKKQYLWHAGTNPVMTRVQRTHLAVCTSTKLGSMGL